MKPSIIVSGDTNLKINLWDIRASKDISLRKLVDATGLSRGRSNNIDNQISRDQDIEELEKIAIALEVRQDPKQIGLLCSQGISS